jgi:hypothetical protein
VALTVTFTVCDAQQIGLSTSGGLLLSPLKLANVRTALPEQKTPPVLAPLSNSSQSYASRKQLAGTPCVFGANCFRYALSAPFSWLSALGSPLNSAQTTRGPPRMDPPLSC